MKRWQGIWYSGNPGEVQVIPEHVEADTMEDAHIKFYLMVNGKPPYPLLSIQEAPTMLGI